MLANGLECSFALLQLLSNFPENVAGLTCESHSRHNGSPKISLRQMRTLKHDQGHTKFLISCDLNYSLIHTTFVRVMCGRPGTQSRAFGIFLTNCFVTKYALVEDENTHKTH